METKFRGTGNEKWTDHELEVLGRWKDDILSGKYAVNYIAEILCRGSLYTRTKNAVVWQLNQRLKKWRSEQQHSASVAC